MSIQKDALDYHSREPKGKIEVSPTKPCVTARDLTLAYSPGVAEPCNEIFKNPDSVYEYTTKGNLVAVLSNGTAVLGLGNIGPLAAKPVMEGKGILFKKFANINVFDIELNASDPDDVIRACRMLEPTFGGINLEDIKAPECFYIEEQLKKELSIPVFHDDQHGTAVISAAAFSNAVEIIGKDFGKMKVVFSGGGAAAMACANMFLNLGVKRENVIMCDSKGVIYKGRKDGMNPYKERFAADTKLRTLAEAMVGADAFIGVSVKGAVTCDMVKSMAKDPIIFAMANPEPEILPEDVQKVRSDAIIATGRSDYPNQVNNVLCFPFIFRGALDVRATQINEEMKVATAKALAALAKEPTPEIVSQAYGGTKFEFGREYLIPKPFDPRVLLWVAPAVAKAASDTGVARLPIQDFEAYKGKLEGIMGNRYVVMRTLRNTAQAKVQNSKHIPKIVFAEGENDKILKAAQIVLEEKIATPILLGNKSIILNKINQYGLDSLKDIEIDDPLNSTRHEKYAAALLQKRQRKGMTPVRAERVMCNRNYFGPMMVEMGDADGVLNGIAQSYPDTIRPMLHTIGTKPGQKVAGIYMMIFKSRIMFFADTTVNTNCSSEELAKIAIETANMAKNYLRTEPRVAMLSYSNFGSVKTPETIKVKNAVAIAKSLNPDLIIDGEMQVESAVLDKIANQFFPFSKIQGDANVLIFPSLESANISYKLLQRLGGAEAIGPILVGMNKPVNVIPIGSDIQDVVNIATFTSIAIQNSLEKEQ
ncbi:MAG: NADP-dependent malic enzyme [Oligoflexia bacterium]|nr:NADP-dependent malic enzyme [Oligoflexia bacterium]